MHKRFTDTDKWDDPWFVGLPAKFKCFWIFILDKCDNAGVWKVNWKAAKEHIGGEFIEKDTLPHFKKRIIILDEFRWFITKFIRFQYGKLSKNCKPHIQVMELLEEHNIDLSDIPKGYPKGIYTLQEKEEEEEEDMEEEKEKETTNQLLKNVISHFCKIHKERGGVNYKLKQPNDTAIIKSWLKTFLLEEIYALIDDYFIKERTEIEQIRKYGYTITNMNMIIGTLTTKKPKELKIVTDLKQMDDITPEQREANINKFRDLTKSIGK